MGVMRGSIVASKPGRDGNLWKILLVRELDPSCWLGILPNTDGASKFPRSKRERMVAAVMQGGSARRQAAVRFGVAANPALKRVDGIDETGRAAPGRIGGDTPKKIAGGGAE